jgi:hypothetical protein
MTDDDIAEIEAEVMSHTDCPCPTARKIACIYAPKLIEEVRRSRESERALLNFLEELACPARGKSIFVMIDEFMRGKN